MTKEHWKNSERFQIWLATYCLANTFNPSQVIAWPAPTWMLASPG